MLSCVNTNLKTIFFLNVTIKTWNYESLTLRKVRVPVILLYFALLFKEDMNIKLGLFLFSFFILFEGFAQREASNWYFGRNAGVQFNPDGSVTPLTDGQLNTLEGCASISDRFGNLLFYTDGVTVWDSTHEIMPGGMGLLGDDSSSQSAIIVPQPESDTIYYIFTLAALESGETLANDIDQLRGLNFYTVDISQGANGTLIHQGNLPDDPTDPNDPDNAPLLDQNFEKITAVRSSDCSSIWVITQFIDTFFAYEVSSGGVSTTPVVSTVGIEIPFPVQRTNAIGYLKASPDGANLAIAHSTVSTVTGQTGAGVLALYDFDTTTGGVNNELILNIDDGRPYGIEFSPNNDVLYASVDFITANGNEQRIFQYDLTAADISASRLIIGTSQGGALQLAPNGRIYHANSFTNTLNVIENPNVLGQGANFVNNAVSLGGRETTFGLPPFIQSLFNEVVNITGMTNQDGSSLDDVVICPDDSFTFMVEDPIAGAVYTWFFDNGTTEIVLPCTTENCTVSDAQAEDVGLYRVEIDPMDGSCPIEGFGFLNLAVFPDANAATLVQCDVDVSNSTDGFTIFNLEEAIEALTGGITGVSVFFFEDMDALNANMPIVNTIGFQNTTPFNQTIPVQIISDFGCITEGQLTLIVEPTSASLPDLGIFFNCDLDATDGILESTFDLETIRTDNYPNTLDVVFYGSLEDAALEINPIFGTDFITESITVFVRIENANECQGIEQFQLIVDPTPDIQFADEIPICLNLVPETVTGPPGFDSYNWFQITSSGEVLIDSDATLDIFEPGQYRLEVSLEHTDLGTMRSCLNDTIFQVIPSDIATIVDIEINDVSDNNNIVVFVEGEGDYEFSLNEEGPYQGFNFFTNLPAGFVTVFVRDLNGCGIVEQTVSIIGFPRFFTPNDDGFNDFWQVFGVSDQFQSDAQITIFDRFGKVVAIIDPSSRGWDGNYNGRPLPSSGYWFNVTLEDGRNFTGHFALKR